MRPRPNLVTKFREIQSINIRIETSSGKWYTGYRSYSGDDLRYEVQTLEAQVACYLQGKALKQIDAIITLPNGDRTGFGYKNHPLENLDERHIKVLFGDVTSSPQIIKQKLEG